MWLAGAWILLDPAWQELYFYQCFFNSFEQPTIFGAAAPIALFGAAPIAGAVDDAADVASIVVAADRDVIKKCDAVYLFFHVLMTAWMIISSSTQAW